MTRDEAVSKYKAAVYHPGGIVWCGSANEAQQAMAAIDREAAAFVDAAAAFGMLKLDESKPQKTLWEILRYHGISLDAAQWICNDALNAGLIKQK